MAKMVRVGELVGPKLLAGKPCEGSQRCGDLFGEEIDHFVSRGPHILLEYQVPVEAHHVTKLRIEVESETVFVIHPQLVISLQIHGREGVLVGAADDKIGRAGSTEQQE